MNEIIQSIITNKIIISCFVAVVLAQSIKVLLHYKKNRSVSYKQFFMSRNMPSSHSAVACALGLSVYFAEGITSLMVVTEVFSLIVIRDAYEYRHSLTEVIAGILLGLTTTSVIWFL